MSKVVKNSVVKYLKDGRNRSAEDITRATGTRNVSATIADLRADGYAIYTNRVNNKTVYRLGAPTRKMVAAAYRRFGAYAFVE